MMRVALLLAAGLALPGCGLVTLTHDSLIGQYLVADPKFDADATLLEHRHRHHRPA